MCRAVRCENCGKTTWAGCGKHVDSVMRNVEPADRCTCARPEDAKQQRPARGPWWRRNRAEA